MIFFFRSDYLESESQILEQQREKHASLQIPQLALRPAQRRAREALDSIIHPLTSEPTAQEEEGDEGEEEEEEPQDEAAAEEEEDGREGGLAGRSSEPTPWAKPEMEVGRGRLQARRKPSIVGMRKDPREDIVDLDSFVNQHYKAKALRLAASSRVKQRTLQRKEEQEPGPVFGLGMELDTGLGMVGLEPVDAGYELDSVQQRKRLQKRDLAGQHFGGEAEVSHRGRLMSMLTIGFSKVDISLCVFLYFLSSLCLLAMYLFFKNHLRLRRAKIALP